MGKILIHSGKSLASKGRGDKVPGRHSFWVTQPLPLSAIRTTFQAQILQLLPSADPALSKGLVGGIILGVGGAPIPGGLSQSLVRHLRVGKARPELTPTFILSWARGAELRLVTMATFGPSAPPPPTPPPSRQSQAVTPKGLIWGAQVWHLALAGSRGRADPLLSEPAAAVLRSRVLPAALGSAHRQRGRGRQGGLRYHLRPTRRRRRARGTEAAASPGPWSCGATDLSLWGPRSASSFSGLVQLGPSPCGTHTRLLTPPRLPDASIPTSTLKPHAPWHAHTLGPRSNTAPTRPHPTHPRYTHTPAQVSHSASYAHTLPHTQIVICCCRTPLKRLAHLGPARNATPHILTTL